jgi:cytochrome P450
MRDFDPLSEEGLRDPFPAWARARRECPVFPAPAVGMWMVARREHVLEALRDTETFSSARNMDPPPMPDEARELLPDGYPWAVPSLANGSGEEHRTLRRHLGRALSRRRVATLWPAIEATADELVAAVEPHGEADVLADVTFPLAERTIAMAVGLAPEDVHAMRRWLAALDVSNAGDSPAGELVAAAREHAAFARRCHALLDGGGEVGDVIAELAACRVPRPQALSALLQVLMAGVATTAHMVGNTLRLVLERPALHAQLAPHEGAEAGERHAALERLVEEGLRHTSPVRGMPRTATRDTVLDGAEVRAGDRLFVLFGSANRDEAFVDRPDEVRIDRDGGSDHLAFGRGAHFCIGAPLARLEGRAALTALLRLPGLRLADDAPPAPHRTLAIHAFKALPVRWDTHSTST